MKESYECELATHIGPESCGAAREGGVEALTGERAGRVFSRVRRLLRDADAVGESGRPHRVHRYREVCQSPARSETPCTNADTSRGNREIPSPPRTLRRLRSEFPTTTKVVACTPSSRVTQLYYTCWRAWLCLSLGRSVGDLPHRRCTESQ